MSTSQSFQSSSTLQPLQILHWIAPVAVALVFLVAKSHAFCMLQTPPKSAASQARRFVLCAFSTVIALLLLSQAIFVLLETSLDKHAPHDKASGETFYVFASLIVWGALAVSILETKRQVQYPYTCAWGIGLLAESAAIVGSIESPPGRYSDNLHLSVQIARLLCILVLLCTSLSFSIADLGQSRGETEPLLREPSEQNRDEEEEISTDDDDDSDDDDDNHTERAKQLKRQQRKHLKNRGSWLAYIKDFRVLFALIWPSNDLYMQACLFGVGILLLVSRALNVLVPRQLGIITNELSAAHETGQVPVRSIGLWVLYTLLNSQTHGITRFLQLSPEQYAYRNIGTTAFSHIMSLSMDFHNDKNSGELMATIGQGRQLYRLLDSLLFHVAPMIVDLVVAFVYVANLFDANMALIILLVGMAYMYLGVKVTVWNAKARRRYNKAWRAESRTQNEAISNWTTVSHFNRASYERDRYAKTVDEFNLAERGLILVFNCGIAAQNVVLLLGRVSAAIVAAIHVAQGSAPVGSFVTLISYWDVIESPFATLSYSLRRLSQMLIDSERLLELLRTPPSVVDKPGAPDIDVKRGRVEFKNVDFAYDARKPTLRNVSFVAEAGKTVALVGETGGGKSTLMKLLYRYYDISGGSITIDGQDIRDVSLSSLRNSFGMVPQDPSLFNMSMLENIRYARLDATDEAIFAACRAAAIHDKILSFPDGYRSKVGERGVKLSGGELQRVAIARAILCDAPIVLLDEATSMVDNETEAVIQEGLKRLTSARTTFCVAHRLSTIQSADLILVVQDGRIIESGNHEELFALGGKYVALWSRQVWKQTSAAEEDKEDKD